MEDASLYVVLITTVIISGLYFLGRRTLGTEKEDSVTKIRNFKIMSFGILALIFLIILLVRFVGSFF